MFSDIRLNIFGESVPLLLFVSILRECSVTLWRMLHQFNFIFYRDGNQFLRRPAD
jgi:hypothetical protein